MNEVEMQVALATLTQVVESGFGEITRRLDSQGLQLKAIDDKVALTNGRVNTLEGVNKERAAEMADVRRETAKAPGTVSVDDLKLYVGLAVGSGSMAVFVTLWVLKIAGKL